MTNLRARLTALEAHAADLEPVEPVGVWHCKTERVLDIDRKAAAKKYPGLRVIFCTTHDMTKPE